MGGPLPGSPTSAIIQYHPPKTDTCLLIAILMFCGDPGIPGMPAVCMLIADVSRREAPAGAIPQAAAAKY
ncbi:hypothetical protein ONZ51_g3836 [Trametes cubensis]|uniref:Uncharacterized protein n=1 Tax=Trametes cubensis TaxID=1111947 RepID=A0AAD7XCP0_9APHY|nr:hypothetical protein ONZ51_g3836 [Trametes cubensis]